MEKVERSSRNIGCKRAPESNCQFVVKMVGHDVKRARHYWQDSGECHSKSKYKVTPVTESCKRRLSLGSDREYRLMTIRKTCHLTFYAYSGFQLALE